MRLSSSSGAIKFIRTNAGGDEFAREQAKALCRCKSDNVVTVYALEDLEDPKARTNKPALVMELVPGETVLSLTATEALTIEDVQRIGLGTINGLKDIQDAGLIHGDLSLENVMASPKVVKIIDILYKHTLAGGDTETKELLRLDDRNSLRVLLAKLIRSVHPAQADLFAKSVNPESSIEEIRSAFVAATDPKLILDVPKLVDQYLKLVTEDRFQDSEEYAAALCEEIPDAVVLPLFEGMISSGGVPPKRAQFISKIYNRLNAAGRRIVGIRLTEALMREVPNGAWPSLLRVLNGCGKQGWLSLTKLCRMRLEGEMVESMKAGYFDTYGNHKERGQLGHWSTLFYSHFEKPEAVLDAVVGRLNAKWYGQNYIGEHFMRILPRLTKTSDDRALLIAGLAKAVEDKAFRVSSNLKLLPKEWQDDVAAEVERRAQPAEDTEEVEQEKEGG